MPTYEVTEPSTGMKLKLTGDHPPSNVELQTIFADHVQRHQGIGQRVSGWVGNSLPVQTAREIPGLVSDVASTPAAQSLGWAGAEAVRNVGRAAQAGLNLAGKGLGFVARGAEPVVKAYNYIPQKVVYPTFVKPYVDTMALGVDVGKHIAQKFAQQWRDKIIDPAAMALYRHGQDLRQVFTPPAPTETVSTIPAFVRPQVSVVPQQQTAASAAAKPATVRVKDPSGKLGTIPAEELEAALKLGYEVAQ